MDERRCPGCGALFQSDRSDLPGFIPSGLAVTDKTVCRRCFRLRHYGEGNKAPVNDLLLEPQIRAAAASAAAVFLVCDALSADRALDGFEWLDGVSCPVTLLVTKADLVEPYLDRSALGLWVSEATGVPFEQIQVLSGLKNSDLRNFRLRLQDVFSSGDRLLFLGKTNAGKSTILSSMLRGGSGPTVSAMPGTTVGLCEYQLEGGIVLLDAPGLKSHDSLLPALCPQCLMALTPKRRLVCQELTLKEGSALCFGGLGRAAVVDGGERGWLRAVAVAPEGVTIHQTSAEKAEELVAAARIDLLSPPCRTCYDTLSRLPVRRDEFALYPGLDLVVGGVGWLAVTSGHGRIRLSGPDPLHGFLRKQLIHFSARR